MSFKINNNIFQDLKADKDFNEILEKINKINIIIHEELEAKIKNNRAIVEDDGRIEKFCETYSFDNPNLIVDYKNTIGEHFNKKFEPKIKDYIKLINIVISNTQLIFYFENKENRNNHLQNINNILDFLEANKFANHKKNFLRKN